MAYQNGTLSQIKVEPEIAPYAASSYAYNGVRAATWALNYPKESDAATAYFEYIVGGNCQNYVSHCVWAGYGGAIAGSGNIVQNILNDVRMVPGSSGWYGCPDGYHDHTYSWVNVSGFWNYVTSNPSLGPKGVGYNDGGIYTNINAADLLEGRVIQLRNGLNSGHDGRYQHSVIVSSTSESDIFSTQYNKIYVCASNDEFRDASLKSKMIDAFGGSDCYMRMIRLTSANFNS